MSPQNAEWLAEQQRQADIAQQFADSVAETFADLQDPYGIGVRDQTPTDRSDESDDDFMSRFDTYLKENHQ